MSASVSFKSVGCRPSETGWSTTTIWTLLQILRRTLRGRNAPELYAPGPEAYEMLKAAVVGGPSLVFTRKHVAGQTRIRSHKYKQSSIVKRIMGFDANSLYPSTMAKEMPCSQEFVEHYEDPGQAAQDLIPRMYSKRWFGFAEVDIEVSQDLWEKFEEFPPIFINQSVGEEGIPQHMKDYLAKSGRVAQLSLKKLSHQQPLSVLLPMFRKRSQQQPKMCK